MSRNTIIGIIVVLVALLVGWYLIKQQGTRYTQPPPTPTYTSQPTVSPQATSEATPVVEKNVVRITSGGFLPKDITIKGGETVTWVNDDSSDHAVNSAVHPTHLLYPPLNLGVVKSGEKKTLEFPTAGTYKYHDHLNPSQTGSVTIE